MSETIQIIVAMTLFTIWIFAFIVAALDIFNLIFGRRLERRNKEKQEEVK